MKKLRIYSIILASLLTWEKGRQLKTFDSNTYTYNANGIRTSKTVDGIRHDYILDGATILRETWNGNTLIPLYDNEDSVCGIIYNKQPFYFQKNLQGDIIAILNANAAVVARYAYDAWGVCTILSDSSDCSIATINPFRYRGYYYDEEIGLYYLQSRYYDPEIDRFLNGDNPQQVAYPINVGTILLYAYCYNNPVTGYDVNGNTPIQAVFATIGAIAGWFLGDYVARRLDYYPNRGSFWSKSTYWTIRVGVIIGGAVIGWFAASLLTVILKGFIFSSPKLIALTPLWIYKFLGIATGLGSVVLGKYPLYVSLAEKLGSSIFQIADSVWKSMSAAAQWAANKAFLDKIIEAGQKITLQTNAYSKNVTGYFAKEINYLLEHGYKIIQGGWGMGPK